MPNGEHLVTELDYREHIERMKPRELAVFTAMQVYESHVIIQSHDHRLEMLEKRSSQYRKPSKKRQATFTGSLVAFLSGVLYAMGIRFGWWQ